MLHRYTLFVVGIGKGATNKAESLVEDYHHYMMVQHIDEMADGEAGYVVLTKMINDPSYSKNISNISMIRKKCGFSRYSLRARMKKELEVRLTFNRTNFHFLALLPDFVLFDKGAFYFAS